MRRYRIQQDKGEYCLKLCEDGDLVDYSEANAIIDRLRAAHERIISIDDKHGQPGQKPVAWTLHECGKVAREALAGSHTLKEKL